MAERYLPDAQIVARLDVAYQRVRAHFNQDNSSRESAANQVPEAGAYSQEPLKDFLELVEAELGLSEEECASLLDISTQAFRLWKKDGATPHKSNLAALARLVNPPMELFESLGKPSEYGLFHHAWLHQSLALHDEVWCFASSSLAVAEDPQVLSEFIDVLQQRFAEFHIVTPLESDAASSAALLLEQVRLADQRCPLQGRVVLHRVPLNKVVMFLSQVRALLAIRNSPESVGKPYSGFLGVDIEDQAQEVFARTCGVKHGIPRAWIGVSTKTCREWFLVAQQIAARAVMVEREKFMMTNSFKPHGLTEQHDADWLRPFVHYLAANCCLRDEKRVAQGIYDLLHSDFRLNRRNVWAAQFLASVTLGADNKVIQWDDKPLLYYIAHLLDCQDLFAILPAKYARHNCASQLDAGLFGPNIEQGPCLRIALNANLLESHLGRKAFAFRPTVEEYDHCNYRLQEVAIAPSSRKMPTLVPWLHGSHADSPRLSHSAGSLVSELEWIRRLPIDEGDESLYSLMTELRQTRRMEQEKLERGPCSP